MGVDDEVPAPLIARIAERDYVVAHIVAKCFDYVAAVFSIVSTVGGRAIYGSRVGELFPMLKPGTASTI